MTPVGHSSLHPVSRDAGRDSETQNSDVDRVRTGLVGIRPKSGRVRAVEIIRTLRPCGDPGLGVSGPVEIQARAPRPEPLPRACRACVSDRLGSKPFAKNSRRCPRLRRRRNRFGNGPTACARGRALMLPARQPTPACARRAGLAGWAGREAGAERNRPAERNRGRRGIALLRGRGLAAEEAGGQTGQMGPNGPARTRRGLAGGVEDDLDLTSNLTSNLTSTVGQTGGPGGRSRGC